MYKQLKAIHGFILNTLDKASLLSELHVILNVLRDHEKNALKHPELLEKKHVNMYEKFKKGPSNVNSKSFSGSGSKKIYDFWQFPDVQFL